MAPAWTRALGARPQTFTQHENTLMKTCAADEDLGERESNHMYLLGLCPW
jgi:hypothetical protein